MLPIVMNQMVVSSQNSYVMILGGGVCEVIRFRWGHVGGVLMMGIVPL